MILFRFGLLAAPALIVFAGGCLASRPPRPATAEPEPAGPNITTVLPASGEDAERLHRLAIKEEAVIDLLDGRITVADAVGQFRDVNAGDAPDETRAAYQVLAFARSQADRRPAYIGPLGRVEAEVHRLLTPPSPTH